MAHTHFYKSSESFFNALIERLDQAQNFAILEYYLFDPQSELGSKLLKSMRQASARGVHVFLRLDGIGSMFWIMQDQDTTDMANVEISVFNPVPWPFSSFLASEVVRPDRFLKYWSRVNQRDHKKMSIIDGNYAFVGSMNVHSETLQWVECGLQCEGPVAQKLLDSFRQLEDQCLIIKPGSVDRRKLLPTLDYPLEASEEFPEIFVQFNRKQRVQFRKRHREEFRQAKKRIALVTPYFVPSFWLIKSLLEARRRGVKVQLVLSGKLDVRFLNWISDKYLYSLIHSGVEVVKMKKKMVHAKVVIADNWMHLGSSNLNQRSSHLDMELNLQVKVPFIQNQLVEFIDDLILQSETVTLESLNQRPWFEKLMGTLLQVFRAIL